MASKKNSASGEEQKESIREAAVKGEHEVNAGIEDTNVRYSDSEGNTEEREPEEPLSEDSAVFPEPTGTDTGSASTGVVAPIGSGATTSAMIGHNTGADHGIEDEGFNKETGFWSASE